MNKHHPNSIMVPLTKTGIPIRNLWYMLIYVWNAFHVFGRWSSEIENAPSLDALLTSVLFCQMQQRLRIGLGRDYRNEAGEVCGVRGRIDFGESLRRMSFPHGRTYSRYQTFQANIPKNQIIRSTLSRMLQVGDLGTEAIPAESLKNKLRKIIFEMEGIDNIELKPNSIMRERLKQKDVDYRLMLSICYLLLLRQMPREDAGNFDLPKLDRDTLVLHDIFEKFVAAFFKRHLNNWEVWPQKTIRWPTKMPSEYLPVMKPDLILQHRQTRILIIIDAKFTPSSLIKGQWDNITFNRDHLFQIYAYLKSQEDRSLEHKSATGILLYPTVDSRLNENIQIQGHNIMWQSIDLAQPWINIESDLLKIPNKCMFEESEF